jgi:hypothetical protein
MKQAEVIMVEIRRDFSKIFESEIGRRWKRKEPAGSAGFFAIGGREDRDGPGVRYPP